MEVHHRLAPILARSHQPDRDAVLVGVRVELRAPAKAADTRLVGKIDGDPGERKPAVTGETGGREGSQDWRGVRRQGVGTPV